jgi:hypothetical protein
MGDAAVGHKAESLAGADCECLSDWSGGIHVASNGVGQHVLNGRFVVSLPRHTHIQPVASSLALIDKGRIDICVKHVRVYVWLWS